MFARGVLYRRNMCGYQRINYYSLPRVNSTKPKRQNLYHSKRYPHRGPNPYHEITCSESARQFLSRLDENGRALLLTELEKQKATSQRYLSKNGEDDNGKVTLPMLKNVFLYNGVPFIGFGFLDNVIMIIAGEYIDVTLGVTLGISTMAAAALGNLISDVAGLGTAGYMEALVSKIGITHPELTLQQASQWQTRWTVLSGRTLGIAIGCIIGMFPLLWFDDHAKAKDDTDKDTQENSAATVTNSGKPTPTSGSR